MRCCLPQDQPEEVLGRKVDFMWTGLSAGLRCPGEGGPARSTPSAARPWRGGWGQAGGRRTLPGADWEGSTCRRPCRGAERRPVGTKQRSRKRTQGLWSKVRRKVREGYMESFLSDLAHETPPNTDRLSQSATWWISLALMPFSPVWRVDACVLPKRFYIYLQQQVYS